MAEPTTEAGLRERIAEALAALDCSKFEHPVPDKDHEYWRVWNAQADALLPVVAAGVAEETARLRKDCQLYTDLACAAERTRQFHKADADRYEAQLRQEIAELQADRDRYRSAWQSARQRAQALGEGIERLCNDRDSWKGWLRTAEAEVRRLTELVGQYADRGIANGQRAEVAEADRDRLAAAVARAEAYAHELSHKDATGLLAALDGSGEA